MAGGLAYNGGPLEYQILYTDEGVGVVAYDDDVMWVYDFTEVYVDDEFRGYRYICRNPEGEPYAELEGFVYRPVGD